MHMWRTLRGGHTDETWEEEEPLLGVHHLNVVPIPAQLGSDLTLCFPSVTVSLDRDDDTVPVDKDTRVMEILEGVPRL